MEAQQAMQAGQAMQVLIPGLGRRYLDGDSLDHSAPLVFRVDGVFQPAECQAMIARIEALGPTLAPISTTRGAIERPDIRNNTRVMFDEPALAAALFTRLAAALPPVLAARRPSGVNERFRCYRYEPGQRFAPHYDGYYQRSPGERSELTLMVYLNDDFTGGTTAFHGFGYAAQPRAGTALLFQHRLLHEGCLVQAGRKYVLRSDVMYRDC